MAETYLSPEEEAVLRDYRLISKDRKVKIKRYLAIMAKAERAERRIERELQPFTKDDRKHIRCSFCGKNVDAAKRMIAGPFDIFICDECVSLCSEILSDPEMEIESNGSSQEGSNGQ